MRAGLFWLDDQQWAYISLHLPTNLTGPERDDDRRIISGIIHMAAARRPNSISRVLSGCSDSANSCNRSHIASQKHRASFSC